MEESSDPWDAPRRISWVARILGPLALVAVVIAFVVVVSGSTGGDEGSSPPEQKTERKNKGDIPKTYVVEPGDSLTSIADKFGISVKRIERLNDGVDAQTLNEGQALKLH